jgi:hypothetical protein
MLLVISFYLLSEILLLMTVRPAKAHPHQL